MSKTDPFIIGVVYLILLIQLWYTQSWTVGRCILLYFIGYLIPDEKFNFNLLGVHIMLCAVIIDYR